MALSPGQLAALQNLGRKHAGEAVGWIGIADAIALTDLGLAERSREGWNITAAGLERLKEEPASTPPTTNVEDFGRR